MSVYAIYSSIRYRNDLTSEVTYGKGPMLLTHYVKGFYLPYLFSSVEEATNFLYEHWNISTKVHKTTYLSKFREVPNSSHVFEFTMYNIREVKVN